jgi:hypothetical protein
MIDAATSRELAEAFSALGNAYLAVAKALSGIAGAAEVARGDRASVAAPETALSKLADSWPPQLPAEPIADEPGDPVSESVRPVASAKPATFPPLTQKTPDRVELLKTLCAIVPAMSDREILRRLNELPGARIPPDNLSSYKIQWGTKAGPRSTVVAPTKPAVAPAAEAVVDALNGTHHPQVVTRFYAQGWGAERGIVTMTLDLPAVNALRRRHQLPPFVIEGDQ